MPIAIGDQVVNRTGGLDTQSARDASDDNELAGRLRAINLKLGLTSRIQLGPRGGDCSTQSRWSSPNLDGTFASVKLQANFVFA